MKRITIGLLIGVLFLTACGQNLPPSPPTSDSVSKTSAPSPLPSATSTITITPLPTIPTFTPTFDVSTIVTVTPAPKAECPIEKFAENYNFDFLNLTVGLDLENRAHAEENALKFLNTYGAIPLVTHLRNNRGFGLYNDLTNDGTPELAIGLTSFFIFTCRDGYYEKLLELPPDGSLTPPSSLSERATS